MKTISMVINVSHTLSINKSLLDDLHLLICKILCSSDEMQLSEDDFNVRFNPLSSIKIKCYIEIGEKSKSFSEDFICSEIESSIEMSDDLSPNSLVSINTRTIRF
ncbi:hypothetical protein D3C87_351380 [compost metagenome]